MTKDKRAIYLILTNEINTLICSACKFDAGGDCCSGSEGCLHPLAERRGFPMNEADGCMEPGNDCWAFRPEIKVSDLADIAGLVLEYGWDEWFWRTYPDGMIKVYGHDSRKMELKS